MAWQKGESGNPGGRLRNEYIKRAAQEHGPKSLETLVKMLNSRDDKVKVVAAQALLDRGYGKSTEHKIVENITSFDEMNVADLLQFSRNLTSIIEGSETQREPGTGETEAGTLPTLQ